MTEERDIREKKKKIEEIEKRNREKKNRDRGEK